MAGVGDQVKWSLDYLLTTYDEKSLKQKRSDLRDDLSEYIKEHGEQDENGNLILFFDELMTVDDKEWYSGLMLQRRVSEFVDDDTARVVIESNDLESRCIKRIVTEVIDYDELYACNQEGLISDEEIDSILSEEETWALVKMKA